MIGYFQNIPKIVLETILVIFFLGAILIQKIMIYSILVLVH